MESSGKIQRDLEFKFKEFKKFMKFANSKIIWGAGCAVLCICAYLLGVNRSGNTNEELQEEIEALQANEADAAVTKRVSQQMENIAYQQKAISDKQRDRAEEQSQLAMQMRNHAESESRLARQAESKAVAAAREAELQRQKAQQNLYLAEEQRAKAQRHQQTAEEQRDKATRAKSTSDTLSFRTLGRTLGSSATSQYESNHKDLANVLAYTSWYYLKKYGANTYKEEAFKALSTCSGTQSTAMMRNRGGVTAMAPTKDGRVVAVSDYGEIEIFDATQHNLKTKPSTVVLQNSQYDFRDVCVESGKAYAISLHGPLCIVDISGNVQKSQKPTTVNLPAESYQQIQRIPGDLLLIIGKTNLTTYGLKSHRVSPLISLGKEISTAVVRKDKLCLFYKDGTYAEMDGNGKVEQQTPLVKGPITAAYYDEGMGCLFLGKKNGEIDIVNKYDEFVTTLYGATGKICSMTASGMILVSASYDKSIHIWNLPMMYLDGNSSFTDLIAKRKKDVKSSVKENQMLNNEWVIPVIYKYSGWPYSLHNCGNNDILIGTSSGQILQMNIMVDDMASKVKAKIKRSLTQDEWNQYIGVNVPYLKIK